MKYYHFVWASLVLCIAQVGLQGPLAHIKWLTYCFFGAQATLLFSYICLMIGYTVLNRSHKKSNTTVEPEFLQHKTPQRRQAASYVDMKAKAS